MSRLDSGVSPMDLCGTEPAGGRGRIIVSKSNRPHDHQEMESLQEIGFTSIWSGIEDRQNRKPAVAGAIPPERWFAIDHLLSMPPGELQRRLPLTAVTRPLSRIEVDKVQS